jgi:hypothetical protein
MIKEKFDDYTKIDHSIPKVNKEDYDTFDKYWEDQCNYLHLKFKNTYGSKIKEESCLEWVKNTLRIQRRA